MPATKIRTRIIARNFLSSSGLYREYNIPWQDWVLAASAVGNYPSASVSASFSGGASGPIGLLFAGASSGCLLSVAFRCPQDMAIAGPAAGSGQLWIDWTSTSVNSGVATMAASVLFIPSGSEYVSGLGGACSLGTACATVTGASLNQINSSSILNFNFPANRNGLVMLRWGRMGQDAGDTCASSFMLFGIRFRYLSDRIGS